MASLLPGMNPDEVTFETALKLLEYPKSLGAHPETGEEVMAANGRYGPYIKSGTETRSIPTDTMSLLDVTLEKAIEILKEPKRRGRATSTPKNLREVGKHPATEAMITIRSGRYGLYVTDGKINASLPRGMTPEELKIDEAVGLLEARAAKIAENGGMPTRKGGRGGRGGAKAAKAPKAAAAPKAKKASAKAKSEPAAVVEAKPKTVVKRKAKKTQDGAVV